MSDAIDDLRALREHRQRVRRARAQRNLAVIHRLEDAGRLRVQRFNGGTHLRLSNPLNGATIDFFPSTGRILVPGARGWIGSLADALDRIGVTQEV